LPDYSTGASDHPRSKDAASNRRYEYNPAS
jgi:hypothetical protein